MYKNKIKLAKILTAFGVMAVTAVMATVAWFYFTVRPDLRDTLFQAAEYGSLKVSATKDGEDIGMNGEIELDIDKETGEMYPGASGSMTVWITTDTVDVTSFIMTYTEAAPEVDGEVLERAKDISERHILFFKNREATSQTAIVDKEGNPVLDEEGNPKYDYTYKYSDPLLPVGEYTDADPVPPYRIFDKLEFEVPYEVTIYWVWPYDYAAYGEIGDYEYLFPPEPTYTLSPDEEGVIISDAEQYDVEDSYIGKVVEKLRFRFFINGKRSIEGLENH